MNSRSIYGRKRTVAGKNNKNLLDKYVFDINEIEKAVKYYVEDIFQRLEEKEDQEEIKHQQMKVNWDVELMYLPFAPKEPIESFARKGGTIFMSKKKPLMIVCNLANEKQSEIALKAQNMNKIKDAPDEIAENFFSSSDVTQR
jgi:hypothetical protein